MCKALGVKPGKALDYLNRWATKLEQSSYDESFNIIRFSQELKQKQPDSEERLRQKKERAMERKKEWLEKNREAMNTRKRELYAAKKALRQQQMYSRFKNALTANQNRLSPDGAYQPKPMQRSIPMPHEGKTQEHQMSPAPSS